MNISEDKSQSPEATGSAQRCPECNGRKVIKDPINNWDYRCHRCEGTGWWTTFDDGEIVEKRCPECTGTDRAPIGRAGRANADDELCPWKIDNIKT